MKAMGMTCGIGSMLIGARQAGFEIVGNIEWRKYYHALDSAGRNTFRENFNGAFLVHAIDDLPKEKQEELKGIDLIMGHPECGNFSILSSANVNRLDNMNDPGDLPVFVAGIAFFKPRFFVMDNLPWSLDVAFPIEKYMEALPEYDLFPEWISNYHYGNVQKHRKRFFLIGALKSERYTFIPGEQNVEQMLSVHLKGVEGSTMANHHPHAKNVITGRARHLLGRDIAGTWENLADYFRASKEGAVMRYTKANGEETSRMGLSKGYWNKHAHVLTGTNPMIHPLTGYPLSPRERLRVQGAPDDFVLYGVKVETDGTWNNDRNTAIIKQTGKFMPVQFCRYVATQIALHLKGMKYLEEGKSYKRVIDAHPCIDKAKKRFCLSGGYSNQKDVCKACWLNCKKVGI